MKQIAVLIVTYNGRTYIEDLFRSLREAERRELDVKIYVVDNASSDDTCKVIRRDYPDAVLVESPENLGFTGGNNLGWQRIEKDLPECDYLYLLNQDTVVACDFLVEAVSYLEANPEPGAAQSLLLLHPDTESINTAGNVLHFLGFGLPSFYRRPRASAPVNGPIGYPSGAAVLLRAELLRKTGLFHADLFLYLEDAELGLKLHLIGRPPHLCRSSVVYHKYKFSSTLSNYRYLERNRWWLIAVHYRLLTLLLLLPALVLMELGQMGYAAKEGLFAKKVRAVVEFFRASFFWGMIRQRRRVQAMRVVGDGKLLAMMTGSIDSPHLQHWLITKVANPVFSAYLGVMRILFRA
jgi:GT2 family glycosyltransferase